MGNPAQIKPNNNLKWGFMGAISAAIAASVCCLGPLILVGLGFSGAWIGGLSAFERYRPLSMLITFGFLAFAFYKVYSKPKADCCETDSYCANPKADKINKIALWSVMVLVIGMLVSPNVIGAFASKSTLTQPATTKQVVLNVEGMTCAACSVTVSKSLKRVDGVQEANVTLIPPEAVVTFDPVKVKVEQLVEATKNVGYPSSVRGGN
ncbi:MAG: cation transporter [Candidatus Omnitrophica bacterium]|nr:cation transporter [Candidatus Omnitrophota bacterium]